ncbi:MAG: hypothetical protein ACAI44_28210 [Candidatus Sericytochromatia bacterium]
MKIGVLGTGMVGQGEHHSFICGNDAEAKADVRRLMQEFGWNDEYILDLGDITNARGTEAMLPLWVRIYGVTGSGAFNFRIVR